jgi:PIN domain nuclease of toxin-antitoxin system
VNLLVDSHVAIWWLEYPARLSARARAALADGRNQVQLSVASIGEIGLKAARNQLRLPAEYVDVLQANGFGVLDIRRAHAERATRLPAHHGAPSTACSSPKPRWRISYSSRATRSSVATTCLCYRPDPPATVARGQGLGAPSTFTSR